MEIELNKSYIHTKNSETHFNMESRCFLYNYIDEC